MLIPIKAGFGWTNGVILDLLTTFGDRIEFKNDLELNPNAVAKEVINDEPPNLPEHNDSNYTGNALALNGATMAMYSSYTNPISLISLFVCSVFATFY